MNDELEMVWNESGHGLMEVLSMDLLGGAETNHEIPSVRVADVSAKIRN
jgi:hypothetical protein